MLDQKMNIVPLPEVKLRKDDVAANNFFGKTAYYDPNNKEIVLYVKGRHNKDIVRSFSHEMVHHMQNIEGRLKTYGTTNTNEDDSLLEIEKEAYLIGNITFRNWEDSLKNGDDALNENTTKPKEALKTPTPIYPLQDEAKLLAEGLAKLINGHIN
jgi:hypothetical protein